MILCSTACIFSQYSFHAELYICMHVCMYVCMYVCTVYVCMYVQCMYVCMYVYISVAEQATEVRGA